MVSVENSPHQRSFALQQTVPERAVRLRAFYVEDLESTLLSDARTGARRIASVQGFSASTGFDEAEAKAALEQ